MTLATTSLPFDSWRRIPSLRCKRLYDLRHTHATLLLLAGVHPKVVAERLGHSSINITLDTYSHVLPSMQEEAARKLDAILYPKAAASAHDAAN